MHALAPMLGTEACISARPGLLPAGLWHASPPHTHPKAQGPHTGISSDHMQPSSLPPLPYLTAAFQTSRCGVVHYLCAVKVEELVINKGNAYTLGGCTLGTASMTRDWAFPNVVGLPWPACVALPGCINAICPNSKDLGNMAFFDCLPDSGTGAWKCAGKVDVTAATPLPYCPTQQYGWGA